MREPLGAMLCVLTRFGNLFRILEDERDRVLVRGVKVEDENEPFRRTFIGKPTDGYGKLSLAHTVFINWPVELSTYTLLCILC